MERNNHLSTLLVEILIAVLFFALSATVLMEMFVAARSQSVYAGVCDEALAEAQNIADRIFAAGDAQALLSQAGFSQEDGVWTLGRQDYDLTVALDEKKTEVGMMRRAEVSARRGEETLLTLPCSRYLPEEVAP